MGRRRRKQKPPAEREGSASEAPAGAERFTRAQPPLERLREPIAPGSRPEAAGAEPALEMPSDSAPGSASERTVRLLSGGVLFLFVFILGLTHISDADTWWHLKTGQLILSEGLPRADPFSYVSFSRPWVSFEWLSQILFYGLYALGGAAALTGFKSLVLACAFFLLWRVNRDRPVWSAALLAAAALGCRLQFVERPFVFDYLFLAGLYCALWEIRFDAPPARLFWAVPLGTALWANLHGGAAALAPLLLAAGAAAERLRDSRVSLARWGSAAGLAGAALALNPNGGDILRHLWDTLNFPGKELIFEWHAPTGEYFGIYGLFLAAAAAAAVPVARRRPFAAIWLLLTALASTRMQRNIPLFLLAAAPAVCSAWAPAVLRGSVPAAALSAPLLAGAFWLHTTRVHPNLLRRLGVGEELPLGGAYAFLERHGIEGRMFNEYVSGGPLIWRGHPRRKVFIDGRNLEYGPERVRAALNWHRPEIWRELDREFDFDYAVLRRHLSGAYTTLTLDSLPEWRLVYWDDEAMVYLKARESRRALIAKLGFELLKPGRANFQYLEPVIASAPGAERVLAELERTLEAAPDCANALLFKAYVLARRGRLDEALAAGKKAVTLFPDKAQPGLTLGWLYTARGELALAERAYSEALARVVLPERPSLGADILNNLGRVKERRGELEAARRLWRKALRWNAAQGDARAGLRRTGGE